MNTLFFVALAVVAVSGLICFFLCKREEERCNYTPQGLGYDCTHHESVMDHIGEYVVAVQEPEPARYYRGDAHPTVGGLVWSSSGSGPNGTPSGRWVTPEELCDLDSGQEYQDYINAMWQRDKPVTSDKADLMRGKITHQEYMYRLFTAHSQWLADDELDISAEMYEEIDWEDPSLSDLDDYDAQINRYELAASRAVVIGGVSSELHVKGSGVISTTDYPAELARSFINHLISQEHNYHIMFTYGEMDEDSYDDSEVVAGRRDVMERVLQVNCGWLDVEVHLTVKCMNGNTWVQVFNTDVMPQEVFQKQLYVDYVLGDVCRNFVSWAEDNGADKHEMYDAKMYWLGTEVAIYSSEM